MQLYETHVFGGRAVVYAHGELDEVARPALQASLERAMTRANDVVVDLSEVQFLDSSALVALKNIQARMDKWGGRLSVRGTSPYLERLLKIVDMNWLMHPLRARPKVQAPAERRPGFSRGLGA